MTDTEIFTALYDQYFDKLVYFASKYTHDEDESKDIVQDCFENVWRLRERYVNYEQFKKVLYTAVHNKAIDWIHHRQTDEKYRNFPKDTAETMQLFSKNIHDDVEKIINDSISALRGNQSKIMHMGHYDSLRPYEIAKRLSLAQGDIRKYKFNALRNMKKNLTTNPIAVRVLDQLKN